MKLVGFLFCVLGGGLDLEAVSANQSENRFADAGSGTKDFMHEAIIESR